MAGYPRARINLVHRVLIFGLMWLTLGLALFALPARTVRADLALGTAADFNSISFYHTGLTQSTIGGGDGDGEVRLLTMGINPTTWIQGVTATGLPARYGHAAVHKNGRIYASGGVAGGSPSAGVYYNTINPTNHGLGTWTASPNSLPYALKFHSMVVANNYLYVLGGLVSSVATTTVLAAPINPDGSVGAWTTTGQTPMPVALSDFASVVVSDTIYIIGGDSGGTSQTAVYYAKPDPSTGAITGWTTNATPLPKPLSRESATVYNGTIYLLGGQGSHLSVIFAHPVSISAEGGAYTDLGTPSSWRT